ncbi:hypothetical protein [Bacillus toyonensis]|uniref:hypothetical protein n=1 Tax=Bacillus toyonensis TaxID=155322 RepID=UPI000BF4B111|nr:hypothetical protein [Bacillus toyonensis]PGF05006.1 hypothetical protein COM61_00800 [Bacillus toyonensis]
MSRMTEETSKSIRKRLDFLLGTGHPIRSASCTLEQEFPNHKLLVQGVVKSYKEEHGIPKTPKFVEIAGNIEDRRKRVDKRTTELLDKGVPFKEALSTVVDEFPQETSVVIRGSFYRYVDRLEFSDVKIK